MVDESATESSARHQTSNTGKEVIMHHAMKTVGLSLILGLFALSSATVRSAELPTVNSLLDRVAALQDGIAVLEQSGDLNHGQAAKLNKKLERATKALSALNGTQPSGDAAAQQQQQQQGSFLSQIQKAIDALLDFVSALTKLVTDLPSDVLQPIIDAALGLVRDLIGLLLG
jgi:hypothetical protein